MRLLALLFVLIAMTSSAADPDLAGRYAGEWKGSSGQGGAFRLNLDHAADGAWKLEVVFVFGGEDVKTTMRSVKVDQSKLDATYDFDLMRNTLRSHITGAWNGKAFDGKYQTTAAEGGAAVDDGVWNAARAK